ncbi:MAG: PDDEXK nuclease domain-containing protein [Terriglobales bacterium]|jgi:hypothetical protein
MPVNDSPSKGSDLPGVNERSRSGPGSIEFSFVARQKRLRVGTEWYRLDLLFFHRRLLSLVLIELKLGKFTHADAGR